MITEKAWLYRRLDLSRKSVSERRRAKEKERRKLLRRGMLAAFRF